MTRDGISSDMPTPDPDYDAHGPSLIERLQLRNYQVTNLTFVLNLTHQCANISRKRCRPSQGLELHTDPSIRASTLPYPHSSSQQPPWISPTTTSPNKHSPLAIEPRHPLHRPPMPHNQAEASLRHRKPHSRRNFKRPSRHSATPHGVPG